MLLVMAMDSSMSIGSKAVLSTIVVAMVVAMATVAGTTVATTARTVMAAILMKLRTVTQQTGQSRCLEMKSWNGMFKCFQVPQVL